MKVIKTRGYTVQVEPYNSYSFSITLEGNESQSAEEVDDVLNSLVEEELDYAASISNQRNIATRIVSAHK